jgi:hypothetical protein
MEQASEPTLEDCLAALETAEQLEGQSRRGAARRPSQADVSRAFGVASAICRLYETNARQKAAPGKVVDLDQ